MLTQIFNLIPQNGGRTPLGGHRMAAGPLKGGRVPPPPVPAADGGELVPGGGGGAGDASAGGVCGGGCV